MKDSHYRAYSKLATQQIILSHFLERILEESKDPHAIRLAKNGLEAARVCKEDEPRALYLMRGEKAKGIITATDYERVGSTNDYQ